jgi:DNA-binding NtrC family response regulator
MKTKDVLIISDAENQGYLKALADAIREKIGPVRTVMDRDVAPGWNGRHYDVIVVDVSNLESLYRLIPEIHRDHPKSHIIIISSTPTWKQTREVIRLGAANLIRKSSDLDEIIDELRLL